MATYLSHGNLLVAWLRRATHGLDGSAVYTLRRGESFRTLGLDGGAIGLCVTRQSHVTSK
jgi:hypothetical protein